MLIVLSLSLASVVYGGLKRETNLGPQPIFVNQEVPIGGTPAILRLGVNSSSTTAVSSFAVDEASSTEGLLTFDGSAYSTSRSLCSAGLTTFFSVDAPKPGALHIATDGQAWISGTWASTVNVSAGWQEVMMQGGTACSITLPGGAVVSGRWNASSPLVSSVPAEGSLSGVAFSFYLPEAGGAHRLIITSSGGFDSVAF